MASARPTGLFNERSVLIKTSKPTMTAEQYHHSFSLSLKVGLIGAAAFMGLLVGGLGLGIFIGNRFSKHPNDVPKSKSVSHRIHQEQNLALEILTMVFGITLFAIALGVAANLYRQKQAEKLLAKELENQRVDLTRSLQPN